MPPQLPVRNVEAVLEGCRTSVVQSRVLLALLLYAAFLAAHGWDVREVARGDDALQLILQQPPDVVVVDLALPNASSATPRRPIFRSRSSARTSCHLRSSERLKQGATSSWRSPVSQTSWTRRCATCCVGARWNGNECDPAGPPGRRLPGHS